jgi:hypothetical protein
VGISIGGIDVAAEIVDLHFQLRRTQRLLEILTNKRYGGMDVLTPQDIALADKDALEFVQKKFPDMGIQKRS